MGLRRHLDFYFKQNTNELYKNVTTNMNDNFYLVSNLQYTRSLCVSVVISVLITTLIFLNHSQTLSLLNSSPPPHTF